MDRDKSRNLFSFVVWRKLFTRNNIGNLQFADRKFGEDCLFMFNYLADAGNVLLTEESAAYYYMQHEFSVMVKKTDKTEIWMEDTLNNVLDILQQCEYEMPEYMDAAGCNAIRWVYRFWFD